MAYAIMRFEKLKAAGIGSLAGSLAHTFRSRYTPNAIPELIKDNRVLLGPETPQGVADAIRERWPDRYRKDAVGCIEYFIGASPEWFQQHGGDGDQERYFQSAIDWLKDHYGAENVVSVVQHNDETTPHLAAYVVPRDPETGNLNAKRWTGGRGVCSEMQTSFHAAAGEPVGLERGVKGSKAEHMSIRRWYEGQADIDKRERAVGLEQWKRGAELTSRETDALFREHDVEDREANVAKRDAALIAEQRSLSEARDAMAENEEALERLSERLSKHAAELEERERRLASLERELVERGERLAGGEAALVQRQAEIDAAGEQLRQRLHEARKRQAAWEAQRDSWLAENRPPAVPELVRHLQHLQSLSVLDAAEYLDEQDSDELYTAFTPQDGLTPQGKALLAKYEGAAEQLERWERTVEPPSGPKGPGL